ncbi:MAG: SGNH/GDSL hydrolase family protein [Bacteroidota bacterium]
MIKKIGRSLIYCAFLLLTVLFLLELCFRCYWFDFYRGNLLTLNPAASLKANKDSTLLVLGDSFSADPKGYVNQLRATLPHYQIVNAAIPGTCARQHALLLPTRIQQFQPDLFIYQIYVGNDLLEWRHPLQSPHISRLRKIYWWLADRIWVLGYLNAKLPQVRQAVYQDLPSTIDPKLLEVFSQEKYSQRSKMLFRAEPELIQNTILLQGKRKEDLQELTQSIRRMIQQLPPQCKVLILPIPHCTQLGHPYVERLQKIGAIMDASSITQEEYPFFDYLKSQLQNDRVHFINLLPHLRQRDSIQAVYYNNDPHLNETGHQIIHEQIHEKWLK